MFHQNKKQILVLLAFFLVLPMHVQAEQVIGKITRLKGSVLIYRNAATIGLSATVGMDLRQNDTIKTKKKSYVRFQLTDGSIMTLGEKAEITLDSFTYDPKKKKRVAFFKMAFGKLRIFANQMLKYRDNRFQVKTPTAVAGVRGTVFMVWVESPEKTNVVCLDSVVEVSGTSDPDKSVVLTKNILTSVKKGKLPVQPVVISEEMLKKFQKGFEEDIRPTDSETGFAMEVREPDFDRKAPDPKLFDTALPIIEPPSVDVFEPEEISLPDINVNPEIGPEPDPDTVLPAPPVHP